MKLWLCYAEHPELCYSEFLRNTTTERKEFSELQKQQRMHCEAREAQSAQQLTCGACMSLLRLNLILKTHRGVYTNRFMPPVFTLVLRVLQVDFSGFKRHAGSHLRNIS